MYNIDIIIPDVPVKRYCLLSDDEAKEVISSIMNNNTKFFDELYPNSEFCMRHSFELVITTLRASTKLKKIMFIHATFTKLSSVDTYPVKIVNVEYAKYSAIHHLIQMLKAIYLARPYL